MFFAMECVAATSTGGSSTQQPLHRASRQWMLSLMISTSWFMCVSDCLKAVVLMRMSTGGFWERAHLVVAFSTVTWRHPLRLFSTGENWTDLLFVVFVVVVFGNTGVGNFRSFCRNDVWPEQILNGGWPVISCRNLIVPQPISYLHSLTFSTVLTVNALWRTTLFTHLRKVFFIMAAVISELVI